MRLEIPVKNGIVGMLLKYKHANQYPGLLWFTINYGLWSFIGLRVVVQQVQPTKSLIEEKINGNTVIQKRSIKSHSSWWAPHFHQVASFFSAQKLA